MLDRQRSYLTRILHETELARGLVRADRFERFAGEEIAVAALERFIERISEASRRVHADLKQQEPGVPWADIAGIGNILRHDYNSVDLAILWNIATRDLPDLEAAVRRLLQSLGGPEQPS